MGKRYMAHTANRSILIFITLTSILFIASVSYVFYSRNIPVHAQSTTQKLAVATPSTESLLDTSQKDTDGDGLSDWEEVLWSTDPNNADTDGDGVHDMEQVYSNKNTSSNSLLLQANTSKEPLTLTDIASRDLFSSFMFSLKKGQTLSAQEQDTIATKALQTIAPLFPRSTYTKDDVHSVPATQETRFRYATSIKTILDSLVANVRNETIPLYKLAYGNRAEAIAELTTISQQYAEYVEKLKEISIPADAVEMHTTLIVTVENYVYILNGFTYFETDPMRSAISINTIQGAFEKVTASFADFSTYIRTHNLHTSTAGTI